MISLCTNSLPLIIEFYIRLELSDELNVFFAAIYRHIVIYESTT